MPASFRSLLVFIGRWPRRLAAAACLALAAAAASADRPSAAASGGAPPGPGLAAGSVAVPVTVSSGGAEFIKRGSRIGLVPTADGTAVPANPTGVIADRLPVLRSPTPGEDGTAVLLVAVPRSQVARLAAHLDRPLLALIDPP